MKTTAEEKKTKQKGRRRGDSTCKRRCVTNKTMELDDSLSLHSLLLLFDLRVMSHCVCVSARCAARRFIHFSRAFIALKKNNNKKQQYWRVHQRRFQSSAVSVVCSQLVVCVGSILISFVVVSMSLAIRIDIWKIGRAVFTNFTV